MKSYVLMMVSLLLAPTVVEANDGDEFFESKIRPILAEHCFRCHSAKEKKAKGGLQLDSREALLKGGESGPVVVPGHPEKSRLILAVSYKDADLQMPPRSKLPDPVYAALSAWVKMGVPWPGPAKGKGSDPAAVFDVHERKRAHWCWQPIRAVPAPEVENKGWPLTEADRFILAKLEEKKLRPAADAEKHALLRRVYFDLVGLPPTPQETEAFLADKSADALPSLVDRLLASPQFGERWARHWLDLMRYAESRGHEFDYNIPNAFQYRDYVIRAFNADVPYNQLLREHLAGDLLPKPRLHAKEHFNESILGTGFWFLGEQVHSPVDICQDKADRFDNMLDVMSKTFLGLTVACARCHDHKFDAISTRDYYSLFGFLQSSSYRLVPFDALEHNRRVMARLDKLRAEHVQALGKYVGPASASGFQENAPGRSTQHVVVDYAQASPWLVDGILFGSRPVRPGDVRFGGDPQKPAVAWIDYHAAQSDPTVDRLQPTADAEKEPGVLGQVVGAGRTLRTPTFTLETGKVYYLMRGQARVYAAVDAHVMIAGPLHGQLVRTIKTREEFQWVEHDLTPYRGRRVHIEFTPLPKADFALMKVVQAEQMPAPLQRKKVTDPLAALNGASRKTFEALLAGQIAEQAKVIGELKDKSRLAPAILDGNGVNEHVYVRGNYKAPGPEAPRRFLEALAGPQPIGASGSGRLALAEQITDAKANPLAARVMVNRIWHHLFGRGIVASVDNLGVLGEAPSHPELLDYLAERFVRDGWSIKKMIRYLILSRTYQMAVHGDDKAEQADPANKLLHRMNLKRLEGEAIRDAILRVSGALDLQMFGPPVPVHLTEFQEGRGRPASGPLDGRGRRSIYLSVRRNFLSAMLLAYDTPIPFSTVGRRTVSNVPAQALILLNDPFVHQQSQLWAKTLPDGSTHERIGRMYLQAFARSATAPELTACVAFVERQTALHQGNATAAWSDLAHVLFNAKEFIYLQ